MLDLVRGPTVAAFWRLAGRQAVHLRLDLSDARQLGLEFFDDFRDLGRQSRQVAITRRSGRALRPLSSRAPLSSHAATWPSWARGCLWCARLRSHEVAYEPLAHVWDNFWDSLSPPVLALLIFRASPRKKRINEQ